MPLLCHARRLLWLALLPVTGLPAIASGTEPTAPAPATRAQAVGTPFPTPQDPLRRYPPAPFRPLAEAQQPIDPADFREPLLAAAIFQATNQQRASLGLPALLPDAQASTAARLHSGWMARQHALSHDEPSAQGPPATVRDRLARQGLRPHALAENIAYNFLLDLAPGRPFYTRLEHGQEVFSYRSGGPPLSTYTYAAFARAILTQWMHSPRHRANIVDPGLRVLGVGTALAHRPGHPDTIYATQDFYTPPASAPAANTGYGQATLLPTPAK